MTTKSPVQNDAAQCSLSSPAGRGQIVVLEENSAAELLVPTDLYELIAPKLPRCLQGDDDDASPGPQFSRLRLRSRNGDLTVLRTHNVGLVIQRLEEAGIVVQAKRRFESSKCVAPVDPNTCSALLNMETRANIAGLPTEIWKNLEICRYGQLVAHSDQQKWFFAALLCAAFPMTEIVFVVASRSEVELVAGILEKLLNTPVYRAYGLSASPNCRIIVATYWARKCLCGAPFLVMPCWRNGFPRWMRRALWSGFADRIYLLRTTTEKLSAHDADGLAGRLGPIIYSPESAETAQHIFSIFRFGGTASPSFSKRRSKGAPRPLINKRELYWRHHCRNQALAAVANAVMATDTVTALMVETTEHAQHLHQLLPDWSLITGRTPPAQSPSKFIIALTAADSQPDICPDQLVFAAGGAPSRWLAAWLGRMTKAGHAVRIIDFTDGFSPQALRLATARQQEYRRAGCHWRPLPNEVVKSVGHALRQSQKRQKSSNNE